MPVNFFSSDAPLYEKSGLKRLAIKGKCMPVLLRGLETYAPHKKPILDHWTLSSIVIS